MLDDRDSLHVLLSEYSLLKGEMKSYIDLFHKHSNFVAIYVSILATFVGAAAGLRGKDFRPPDFLFMCLSLPWPYHDKHVYVYQALVFFAYVCLLLVGWFFVAATMSYIYILKILATRGAVVERNINALVHRDLLVWEIGISPRLIHNMVVKTYWIGPSAIRVSCSMSLLILVLVVQMISAKASMGCELGTVFCVVGALGLVFFCVQGLGYTRVGIRHISGVVEHEGVIRDLNRPPSK